jgi:tellurite resistance protein
VKAQLELMVKALVAVAWADGRLHTQEEGVLQALAQALDLSAEETAALREYARSPRTLDEVPVAELSAHERLAVLRHAVLLTYVDGEQTADERGVLAALVLKLQIPASEASGVIQAAARRASRLVHLV